MKWFRIEDATEERIVLVQAENAQDACAVYMKDYPPDLYAKEATRTEIAAWLKDPWPWPTT